MSTMQAAIRRRRMAKHDERYVRTKRDKDTSARRLARVIAGERERAGRKKK